MIERYSPTNVTFSPSYLRNVSVQEELTQHPERLVNCSPNHLFLDYCQVHYLMLWDSKSSRFSNYQPHEIVKGNNCDVTYSVHTSYGDII